MPETPPRNTFRNLVRLSQYNDYKRLTKYPLDTAFSEKLFLSFLHSRISKIAMAEICLKAETGSATGCEWLVACDCKEFGQAEEGEF